MSGENYRSASKSHEPGWNDPPKVAYVGPVGPAAGPSPKALLNKRVAFPLQGSGALPGVSPPKLEAQEQSMPPLMTKPGPLANVPSATGPPCVGVVYPPQSAGSMERNEGNVAQITAGREELLANVRSVFDGSIQRMEDARRGDISKRINLIYESWTSGKLPDGLEKQLHNLANALIAMNAPLASGIHRSIICDYGSVCALWAPALRQLIFALPKQFPDEPSDEVIAKPI